jgi:hypothetical protein
MRARGQSVSVRAFQVVSVRAVKPPAETYLRVRSGDRLHASMLVSVEAEKQ